MFRCSDNVASQRHAAAWRSVEVEGALAVRRCTHDSRPSPYLAHDALEWIIRADALPVLAGKGRVRERVVPSGTEGPPPLTQIRERFCTSSRASTLRRNACIASSGVGDLEVGQALIPLIWTWRI